MLNDLITIVAGNFFVNRYKSLVVQAGIIWFGNLGLKVQFPSHSITVCYIKNRKWIEKVMEIFVQLKGLIIFGYRKKFKFAASNCPVV